MTIRLFTHPLFTAMFLTLFMLTARADPSAVEPCSPQALTHDYVTAIERRDLKQMASYMDSDIHYQDPTMAFFGNGGIDLKGKTQTIAFWREAFKQAETQKLDYKILRCFAAGPEVILDMTLQLQTSGAAWDIDQASVELTLQHIMSLRLENNAITQQIDYVDYQSMFDQISRLQSQHGTSQP